MTKEINYRGNKITQYPTFFIAHYITEDGGMMHKKFHSLSKAKAFLDMD